MAITLYHVDWCPDCHVVRHKLTELGLAYEGIIVPDIRRLRTQVHKVSGQYYVPVLHDGDLVLTETADILAYLDDQYGSKGSDTAAKTRFPSQIRTMPDAPTEDDDHPSCKMT